MTRQPEIDIGFDVRSDTPAGKDPDTYSRTLGRYHQLLWSRRLPNGAEFELVVRNPPICLHHQSDLGEFWLSSDSVIHTYTSWLKMQPIISQIPESENAEFRRVAYTVGAMMVWPANQIDRRWTINQARGCMRRISDRFDLTVECIRRYYVEQASPLKPTIERYADFFALFRDFRGFVDFFLLQDLVSEDYSNVRFFMPFDDFRAPAVSTDLVTYLEYRRRSIEFVESRNQRIAMLGR